MRSCASRGARSPGSARNRSSCSCAALLSMPRKARPCSTWASAPRPAGIGQGDGGVALGGEDGSDAGIGGRILGADIGPGLEVVERIDDAAADLAVLRTRAVGAVLLQRATGQAEESRGFGRSEKARRQTGQGIGHSRASVISWSATEVGGALEVTVAEQSGEGGCRR